MPPLAPRFRRRPPRSADRAVRRLADALDPPVRGARPRLAGVSPVAAVLVGMPFALLATAELHLDGPLAIALRAVVVLALALALSRTLARLHTRNGILEAVRHGQDAVGEATVVIDPVTLRVLHASPAAAQVYARPLESLVGMRASELALPEERDQVEERRRLRAAGHRVPSRREMQLAHPGAEPRWVEWASVPLVVQDREVLLSLARDVSARVAVERRLAEEHAFLEAVLDTADCPIAVLRADGRLLRANAAAARLAGPDRAPLAGRTPVELGLISATAASSAAEALRGGRDPHRTVVVWNGADGRERAVAWTVTAMRTGERITSIVCAGVDLTERRAAELDARLARAALDVRSGELERAQRDLEHVTAVASAEGRAAAHAVAAGCRSLAARAAVAPEDIEAVAATADRLHALLDGLADHGRPGAGDPVLRTADAVLAGLGAGTR